MSRPAATPKSRLVAALLGLVTPGLGQVFLGHALRGLAFALVPPVGFLLFFVLASDPAPKTSLLVIFGAPLLAYLGAIVDTLLIPPSKHRPASLPIVLAFALAPVLLGPVVAVILRMFVLEAFKAPSGSMSPSLVVGDHFFTDKAVYRKRPPRRGEVVVFKYPEHPEQDFVKRAIAIEGDTLEVKNGHPFINGWEVPSCRVGTWRYTDAYDGDTHEGDLFVEFLDASSYLVFLGESALPTDYQGPFVAKPGETWVLGDNRNNAHDSRMWFGGTGGGVPSTHVKGRARLIWLGGTPGRGGHDLGGDPSAPSPELAAPLAACLAKRPSITTPPPAR